MFYNFVRIHQTLRITPMAAGVADRVWEMSDIVRLLGLHGKRRYDTRGGVHKSVNAARRSACATGVFMTRLLGYF
jgi:hypothetical protein